MSRNQEALAYLYPGRYGQESVGPTKSDHVPIGFTPEGVHYSQLDRYNSYSTPDSNPGARVSLPSMADELL